VTIRVIKLDWFVFVRRDVLSFFGVEVDGRSDVACSSFWGIQSSLYRRIDD
jgi:hypothetical protein